MFSRQNEGVERSRGLYYFMIQVPVTDSAKARAIRDPDTNYYVNQPGLNITLPPNSLNEGVERSRGLYYFMIQVPVTDSAKARAIRDPDTNYYVNQPGLNITLPPNSLIVDLERQNVTATMFRASCHYFSGFEWRSDSRCKNIPVGKLGAVKCHCYVDAPYTVRLYRYNRYKTFLAGLKDYPSTSLIPATFVLVVNILAIFYCYWSHFQDMQEKHCAQIHVVKDMYKPQSPEQYLVCICTGALPGSGTNKRVSFLLVGEFGSLQTITPEGKICFPTGSEIWFLMSSDLEIGPILGVTVNYDRAMFGTELHPWFLKRVIVYSKRFNHVIRFDANRSLGIHLPSLVLPTIPYNESQRDEVLLRFWQIMKTYHLLASVMLHVPGKGITKFHSAVASLTVVMASAAIGIEVFGEPSKALYEQELRVIIGNAAFIKRFVYLSGITCCLSLLIKMLFALIYSKPISMMWYNKLHSRHDEKRKSQVIKTETETWLTNKRPLPYEPEIHPQLLLRNDSGDADAGLDRVSGSVQFGAKLTSQTPRTSMKYNMIHSIHREDDGTFSMLDPTSLRSSLRSARMSKVLGVDKNKNQDDSGLDDYGHENYQRNASCSLSGFTDLPRPISKSSKALCLHSKNGTENVVGRENLESQKSDICQCCNSQRSLSDVHTFDADEQGISTSALCPKSLITTHCEQNECCLAFLNAKDNTSPRKMELGTFSQLPYQDCTNTHNMRPSLLPQPDFSSFRFSRGASYFDKLMNNHKQRSGKDFLHERSTDMNNSPDMNYGLFDLAVDHNHLRCLKAASKSVGVNDDVCLATDNCSDANTFTNVSHNLCETNMGTSKTRSILEGKRRHSVNGTKCIPSVTAVVKCLIRSACCICRFPLLISSHVFRITRCRKESSLDGIRLDGLCTPPSQSCTPEKASYCMRRIQSIRQEGEGRNYEAIGDSCCENCAIDIDKNYSAVDQIKNSKILLRGSRVDETSMCSSLSEDALPNTQIDTDRVSDRRTTIRTASTGGTAGRDSTSSLCSQKGAKSLFQVFKHHKVRCPHTVWDQLGLLRLIVLLLSVCTIIFSTGWVAMNGLHYSFVLSVDWFVLMVTVLLFELIVLEPCILLCCAAVSTRLWKTPVLIRESLERFKVVTNETTHRDLLIGMSLAGRHMTSFMHTQATPGTSSLQYLHDKIYKALKKTRRLPDVVFESGVYWLIFYTVCIIILVNLNTDIYQANTQGNYVYRALGLHQDQQVINVDQMWIFFEKSLIPGLLSMEDKVMTENARLSNISGRGKGYMLISPIQFHQIRVKPYRKSQRPCSPLTYASIQKERQCNYEYSEEDMETNKFDSNWNIRTTLGKPSFFSRLFVSSLLPGVYAYRHGAANIPKHIFGAMEKIEFK
ncbi:polycystic kidney disease protein 1-like 2 [Plakobranchus ocellatus]|uniref:Polycystic kidney disease protein 1-like 2 n=1 Tax=Plakobranchus ocellatus TaxID=259542 RepID=A0AAV3YKC5_9GAST|nr:polycystic kidney disease protein 1-like 2 [Plakobranchus ocellatus]